jgi:hypothetical protein
MIKPELMKRFITILFLLTLYIPVFSQSWKLARLELYGGLSALQYFGDIGGSPNSSNLLGLKDISFTKTRPGLSLGIRYQIDNKISIKGSYISGLITQSDVTSGTNVNRNYSFNTFINEFSVVGEYYLIPESDQNYFYSIMQVRGGLRHFKQPWSLYLFLGAGSVYYNVTPKDALVDSPRFSDDPSIAFVIPGGIGAKYAFMPRISAGAELCLRYTTSNNLDGYDSVHGKYNDLYQSLLLKINFKLTQKKRPGVKPPSSRKKFFF